MQTFLERTQDLFKKIKEDSDSKLWYRNQIVEINMKLVSHVLKKYKPYTDDQFQTGCMGLILAVDTFKEEREVPFHFYACFCIERELHKAHRQHKNTIEGTLSDQMIYLDERISLDNGDDYRIIDTIADILAEEDFEEMIELNDLNRFFDKVVNPILEYIATCNKGQSTKTDLSTWKELEKRYLLELSQGSQKTRFNLSQMAKHLKISVQCVRNRHLRTVESVKKKAKEEGYK